jgi:hypothetical protein
MHSTSHIFCRIRQISKTLYLIRQIFEPKFCLERYNLGADRFLPWALGSIDSVDVGHVLQPPIALQAVPKDRALLNRRPYEQPKVASVADLTEMFAQHRRVTKGGDSEEEEHEDGYFFHD